MLDVKLTNLKDSGRVIQSGSTVHFYHGSRTLLCKAVLLDRDALEPGQSCYAQLRMTENVAAKRGDRFVIRFYSPLETIGGGVVLDDCPPRRKRNQPAVLEELRIRESGSADQQLVQLVGEYGYRLPSAGQLAERRSCPEEELAAALADQVNAGRLVEVLPRRYLTAAIYQDACRSVEKVLEEYHRANPLHAGMAVAALRQKAFRNTERKEADAILAVMLRGGTIVQIADRCALPAFRVVLTRRQEQLRQRILQQYRTAGRETPFADDLYASFQPNERDDCRKVLENLVSCGELVMLTPQLFYHREVYEEVCRLSRDFFAQYPTFTLAQYRDLLATSRKYALAILEYFDKNRITKKVDDSRVVIGTL
jgi:selenocysteine-specific elongation factor